MTILILRDSNDCRHCVVHEQVVDFRDYKVYFKKFKSHSRQVPSISFITSSATAPAACAIRAFVVKVQFPRCTNAAWLVSYGRHKPNPH